MVGSVPGMMPHGVLARIGADAASQRTALDVLTRQVASGRRAQGFADLGAQTAAVLGLDADRAVNEAWQANVSAATGRMRAGLAAIDRIMEIAARLNADLARLNGLDGPSVDVIAADARAALREVAGLLNTQYAGAYVFAGQDSANPPVPDADAILSSGFYTQIAAAVGGLAGAGAAATAAATLGIAASNAPGTSPFSAFLSRPAAALQAERAQVETGMRRYEATGLLASANSAVPSQGTSTTGAYMRDVLRALATVGAMDSSQLAIADYPALVRDTRESLRGAIAAMGADAGVFGDGVARLEAIRARAGERADAARAGAAAVTDVDMAAALSRLSQLQTQLQASYQMIAQVSGLSLARFLSGG